MSSMPFGLKIALLDRAFQKKMDERAGEMGLTAVQLRVLGSVSRLEAAGKTEIHQNDLERIQHVTHPAMTKLLGRLEAKGFVRCLPSAQDRRYKVVSCTEKSAGIHKMILEQDRQVWEELCRPLTPQQTRELARLMDLVLEDLDPE